MDAEVRTVNHPIEFVLGIPPSLEEEVRVLLRRRLAAACLILSVLWAVWLLQMFLAPAMLKQIDRIETPVVAVELCLLVGTGLLLYYRGWSLRQLRLLEMLVFASAVATLSIDYIVTLASDWLIDIVYDQHVDKLLFLFGDSSTTPFLALVVLYGTYIPNHWKRCLVMVLIFMAPLIVLSVICAIRYDDIAFSVRQEALMEVLTWSALGILIAVVGAHQFTRMREEVHAKRQLGRYRLMRRLGSGGMGYVYLAEHQLMKRPCAVKIIRAEAAQDAHLRDRFQREVRTLAQLTHENIVEIYDYGESSDGNLYYVMEYLEGIDLGRFVQRYGSLPPGRAVRFLLQACAALREIHGQGMIHRDIKPSNLFVCHRRGDVIKVLDFGLVHLAASSRHLTHTGQIVGTPGYLAPEILAGKQADHRIDIYALGMVAFVLLTGKNPFDRENVEAMLHAQLHEPAPAPMDSAPLVPDDLNDIIVRCLAREPDERFQSAEDLERALTNCSCVNDWTAQHAERWWREYGNA